jgi:hypothetical protein
MTLETESAFAKWLASDYPTLASAPASSDIPPPDSVPFVTVLCSVATTVLVPCYVCDVILTLRTPAMVPEALAAHTAAAATLRAALLNPDPEFPASILFRGFVVVSIEDAREDNAFSTTFTCKAGIVETIYV